MAANSNTFFTVKGVAAVRFTVQTTRLKHRNRHICAKCELGKRGKSSSYGQRTKSPVEIDVYPHFKIRHL